jgi:hypothetical protein
MPVEVVEDPSKPEPADVELPSTSKELQKLMNRAGKGDASCLPTLRALLKDPKRGPSLVEALGSPPAWLKNELFERSACKDLAIREAMERKLARVRADLEGPNPSPMERLLAERAALCWLMVYQHEQRYAANREMTFRQSEHEQKRIDRAHHRFLSAVKTLAQVRKLAVPAIQVNIAREQVNVAGGDG